VGCLIVDKREGRNTAELIQALFAVVAVTPVSASPGNSSSGAFTRVVPSCSPHPVGLNPIRVFASAVQNGIASKVCHSWLTGVTWAELAQVEGAR
jgi:hypothetical protein